MLLKNIKNFNSLTNLKKGLFILIINIKKIPPHIALICNGKYYSLTINGADIKEDYLFLSKIKKKKIPTIFIELKTEGLFFNNLENFYNNKIIELGKNTCLYPVKKIISLYYKLNLDNINYVYQLIDILKKNDYINAIYSINYPYDNFKFTKYTFDEINAYISKLKKLK